MKVLIHLLIAAVLCHSHALAAKPAATPTPEAWVERKLDRIIIPRIDFRETPFIEAVEFLRKEARRLDPRKTGIPITVQLETSKPAEPPPQPIINGLSAEPAASSPGELKITISLTKISLREALRYFTGLANMKFWVRPDGIHIVPALEPEPMFTREFAIPDDLFPAMEKEDRIAHTGTAAEARNNFQSYLIANGVAFPTGATATLNPDAKRLTIHNTKDQFDLIAEILKSTRPVSSLAVPGPEVRKFSPLTEIVAEQAQRKRMERIILHDVVIKKMNLPAAVHYLRSFGIRFDMREPPSRRGVNIVVSDDKEFDETATEQGDTPPIISYVKKKVSLFDAVQAVAELSGRKVEFLRYASALVPKNKPIKLMTQEYLVPPDFMNHSFQGPPAPAKEPDNAKDWLVSGGVDFHGGPSAIYIASSRRLIVRDTAERLKAIEKLTEATWREYYAAHPPKKKSRR